MNINRRLFIGGGVLSGVTAIAGSSTIKRDDEVKVYLSEKVEDAWGYGITFNCGTRTFCHSCLLNKKASKVIIAKSICLDYIKKVPICHLTGDNNRLFCFKTSNRIGYMVLPEKFFVINEWYNYKRFSVSKDDQQRFHQYC